MEVELTASKVDDDGALGGIPSMGVVQQSQIGLVLDQVYLFLLLYEGGVVSLDQSKILSYRIRSGG